MPFLFLYIAPSKNEKMPLKQMKDCTMSLYKISRQWSMFSPSLEFVPSGLLNVTDFFNKSSNFLLQISIKMKETMKSLVERIHINIHLHLFLFINILNTLLFPALCKELAFLCLIFSTSTYMYSGHYVLTHFRPIFPFYALCEHQETCFSGSFKGYKMGTLARNGSKD